MPVSCAHGGAKCMLWRSTPIQSPSRLEEPSGRLTPPVGPLNQQPAVTVAARRAAPPTPILLQHRLFTPGHRLAAGVQQHARIAAADAALQKGMSVC